MNPRLFKIMKEEVELLEVLLNFLEKQYNLLTAIEKDIVIISKVAEEIDEVIKNIANLEIEKKNILQEKSLLKVVEGSNNEEAKQIYSETLRLLDNISVQKDTNYLFTKQQLFFTKSMIRAITPKRNAEVYDNFGKIRK